MDIVKNLNTRRVVMSLLLLCSFVAQAFAGPNIISIVTDDQGQWAMGAYGNEDIHTPNMDRIAAEGALFLNAFAAVPVCSPARAVFMTGRYPTELGITDWISPAESEAGAGMPFETWVEVLQGRGYATGLFGKWHLGSVAEHHPRKRGYDEFYGFVLGGNTPKDPTLEVDGVEKKVEGFLPDVLTDAALEWLAEVKDGGKPFELSLHFRAPHLPYGPVPMEDMEHYKSVNPELPEFAGMDRTKVKQSTLTYYASISSVDRNVGRLLEFLDANGLAENTFVLFTSDHGYNEGRHGINTKGNGHWIAGGVNGPKRPNMWDTSLKVPMAVRWPGVIAPGTRYAQVVSHLDMYRTMVELAGETLGEGAAQYGVSFVPLMQGREFPEERVLFGQYDLHNGGLAYMRMLRTAKYKYVRHFHAEMMDELYDLEADPGEEKNLFRGIENRGDPDGVIADLRAQLLAEMVKIDDPLLRDEY